MQKSGPICAWKHFRRPDLDQLAEEYFEHYKKLKMVDLFLPLLDKFVSRLNLSNPS